MSTVDGANVFGTNLSGLAYEGTGTATPEVLWAVKNGPSKPYRLLRQPVRGDRLANPAARWPQVAGAGHRVLPRQVHVMRASRCRILDGLDHNTPHPNALEVIARQIMYFGPAGVRGPRR